MPAGAISGVADVTEGSVWFETGAFTNSATGTCSAPETAVSPVGVLVFPQLHGAYQEAFRTDDAVTTILAFPVAPVLHLADCSGLARHDGTDNPAVRGREENYIEIISTVEDGVGNE
jgi:hypothetical protein